MFQNKNEKSADFLEDHQESAEKAFGQAAPQMIESLLYAKMPADLKTINQEYLVNGTYEKVVQHSDLQMELNGLEADEILVKNQMTVVKQQPTSNTPQNYQKQQNQRHKLQTPSPIKLFKTTNVDIARKKDL